MVLSAGFSCVSRLKLPLFKVANFRCSLLRHEEIFISSNVVRLCVTKKG